MSVSTAKSGKDDKNCYKSGYLPVPDDDAFADEAVGQIGVYAMVKTTFTG